MNTEDARRIIQQMLEGDEALSWPNLLFSEREALKVALEWMPEFPQMTATEVRTRTQGDQVARRLWVGIFKTTMEKGWSDWMAKEFANRALKHYREAFPDGNE